MAFHKLSKYNDEDENSIHFITAKINKNKPFFKDENLCKLLIDEIKRIRKELGFKLLGYVIIYCHIHLLIYYEVKDIDLSVGVLPSDLQNNNSAAGPLYQKTRLHILLYHSGQLLYLFPPALGRKIQRLQ